MAPDSPSPFLVLSTVSNSSSFLDFSSPWKLTLLSLPCPWLLFPSSEGSCATIAALPSTLLFFNSCKKGVY